MMIMAQQGTLFIQYDGLNKPSYNDVVAIIIGRLLAGGFRFESTLIYSSRSIDCSLNAIIVASLILLLSPSIIHRYDSFDHHHPLVSLICPPASPYSFVGAACMSASELQSAVCFFLFLLRGFYFCL